MPMFLSGASKTGSKIMKNISKFNLFFEKNDGNTYFFNWSFDNYQSGHLCVVLDDEGNITSDSLLSCNVNQRDFKSTLGLYKDPSLKYVCEYALQTVNIK